MRSKRIDDLEKRKAVKIGIARTNAPDAVFPHENCCVGVVKQVSPDERELRKNLRGNECMPLRWNEHLKARRSEQD